MSRGLIDTSASIDTLDGGTFTRETEGETGCGGTFLLPRHVNSQGACRRTRLRLPVPNTAGKCFLFRVLLLTQTNNKCREERSASTRCSIRLQPGRSLTVSPK